VRVLHVLNELRPSGAESMLRVAATLWRENGIECEILSTGETLGSYELSLRNAGYPIHSLPFSRSFAFPIAFYRFLKKQRFDVVHLHAERANFWLGFAARLAGAPSVVRTIHNVFEFHGVLRLRRRWQRALLSWMGVIHVSISASVEACERERFRNETVRIENWYDSIHFVPPTAEERRRARLRLNIGDEEFAIVSVGNCAPAKNHAAVIEAISRISETMGLVYLHVGLEDKGGDERRLAHELGLSSRVRFIGHVEDPLPILHASDLYVMPSTHEGFSIAALEALAVGLPAVLSDVAGLRDIREILTDGILWVEPLPDPIAKAILGIARAKPQLPEVMHETTHRRIRERYSVERGVQAYAALYRVALKGR
jgi:glycosyltransferase involved in cell wall biosynthesis